MKKNGVCLCMYGLGLVTDSRWDARSVPHKFSVETQIEGERRVGTGE